MHCSENWTASDLAQTLALVEARRGYYREMLTRLPAGAAVLGTGRMLHFANTEFCRIFEIQSEYALNRSIDEILPGDSLTDLIRTASGGMTPAPLHLEIKEKLLRISAASLPNWRNASQLDILLLAENLTEIRQERLATQIPDASSTIPPHISDSEIPAIFWQADAETFAFESVRGAAGELLGYPIDHWLKTPDFFSARIDPSDRTAVLSLYRAAIARGADASAEFRCSSSPDQSAEVWVRETIRVSGRRLTGVIISLGARKRFEEQEIRAARWTALRNWATESAHELHNMSLTMETPAPAADSILPEIERIAHITGELLNFASHEPNPLGVVSISRALEALKDKITAAVGQKSSVNLHAGERILVFAEDTRLDEVILALVASLTRDALENSCLTITCSLETVSELVPGAVLTPGSYARVTVKHEGRGLDLELQGGLFESFRNAANSKQSTRFALSRAYTVVRSWGGDIAFSSEPNRSAEFLLYLPHCPQFDIDPLEVFEGPISDEAPVHSSAIQDAIDTLLQELTAVPQNSNSNGNMSLDSTFVESSLP